MAHSNPESDSSEADVAQRTLNTGDFHIQVNGEDCTVQTGATVSDLLAQLGIEPDRVAVELNRSIVRKPHWEATELKPGAVLEIVQFVGGG